MYINDICSASENLNFVLYADDTTFYTTHDDTDILFNRTKIELKRLYNCLCLSKLLLNADKSNYVILPKKYYLKLIKK